MKAYIKGLGVVSPQKTWNKDFFLEDIVAYNENILHCIEPEYKQFINPIALRRMSRIIKMSIAASKICLADAEIELPEAIISSTGLGCMEDTEKFLMAMIENEEKFLQPTSFIQSTHNTVSSQIAINLKCNSYNNTYVHRGFSFETALLDGLLLLNEGSVNNALVGGFDEITKNQFLILNRADYWKKDLINSLDLLNHNNSGSLAGEGTSYFLLSNKVSDNKYGTIAGLQTFYKPENISEVKKHIHSFLEKNNLESTDIDVVLYGLSGDSAFDEVYYSVMKSTFLNSTAAYFKHLCGEYHTASAFALWLAAKVIQHKQAPASITINKQKKEDVKNILIYNHFRNINHSLILVTR